MNASVYSVEGCTGQAEANGGDGIKDVEDHMLDFGGKYLVWRLDGCFFLD